MSTRSTRPFLPRRAALAAGAVLAAGAIAVPASALATHSGGAGDSASAGSAPALRAAAHQRFAMTYLTLKNKDRPTKVVAAGPIHGRGTMVERVVKETASGGVLLARISLPGGKVTLRVKDTESMRLDRRSCTARQSGKGTWRIVAATGAYKGASGHGSFVRRAFVVGAFDSSGTCLGESAPPVVAAGTVVANGTATH